VRLLAILLLAGCATAAPAPAPLEEPPPTAEAPPPPPPPAPACTAFARPGVLKRSVVSKAVDGGLGRWLGNVDVDPARQDGRFRGWIIRRLVDPCFAEVDLRPGDVVTRINGRSVERPGDANDVFVGLRTAPALVVDYTRGGAPQKLTLPIEE
jgi:S1-C subfamily serine protease